MFFRPTLRARAVLLPSLLLGTALTAATSYAQSNPNPAQTPPASAPAPAGTDPNSIPALPAYRHGPPGTESQPTATPQTPAPDNSAPPAPQPGAQTPAAAATSQSAPSLPTPQTAPPPAVTDQQPTEQTPFTAMPAYGKVEVGQPHHRIPLDPLGSAYIPVDSWVYPAMLRLYSMGYLDSMYLAARPYTRRSALHILQRSEDAILSGDNTEAQEILAALLNDLSDEGIVDHDIAGGTRGRVYGLQSVYTRAQGISGNILNDSFHLGQTFFDDYGRPHQPGFNNLTGFSTLAEQGRWSMYLRGEYEHAPSAPGYSQALSARLSSIDEISPFAPPNNPQSTIPSGPIPAKNPFRIVEATLSFHLLGHEISGGKSDAWLGPAQGGAMAWSNNAEDIYSFRINRVEPLRIKYLSRLVGPVRYDFFYGSLKGQTDPNSPYTHSETVAFSPTRDFQFSLQRTIVFGGEGHEPVTFHTFLVGFFDTNDTNPATKFSRHDPGARFSAFSFSYRLPFVRNYLTLYADSETHDDIFPISAPRRAGYRPGIYLSQFPGAHHLDLRVEAVSTDCVTLVCQNGSNEYVEDAVRRQAYTNKGIIMGDWVGREGKGGQAFVTYHLSGSEWVQLSYLHKKTAKDFIPGGTTQNQFSVDVVKRLRPDIELQASYQHEGWKAPIYLPGAQSNNSFTFQLTFLPKLHTAAR